VVAEEEQQGGVDPLEQPQIALPFEDIDPSLVRANDFILRDYSNLIICCVAVDYWVLSLKFFEFRSLLN